MKYDVDIDQPDPNTSHSLILDFVGQGQRVLDVGCSTGYLAKLLKERGNTVVGVEIDAEAAATAEKWTEHVIVGDLEELDLVGALAGDSFDVIIFADVLEHLLDPGRVLRQSTDLLRPGGFAVLSIPNVAHGAVRLALLDGRFEYTTLGLLDDTHFRFFTRSAVENLIQSAGLVPTEFRRTTADAFATEIPLDPDRFSTELIDRVRADPDASTYQFVVRAIPLEPTSETVRALASRLVAADHQLQTLRQQLDQTARVVGDFGSGPAIGVFSSASTKTVGPLDLLRASVLETELRRRLLGFGVRRYAVDEDRPDATWTGDPVYPLLPWSEERAQELSRSLDAVVTSGPGISAGIVSGLVRVGCPVFAIAPDGHQTTGLTSGDRPGGPSIPTMAADEDPPAPGAGRPDLLWLANRLHSSDVLDRRVQYLRLLGRIPDRRQNYILVALDGRQEGSVAALSRSLEEIGRRLSADLLFVEPFGTPGAPVEEMKAHLNGPWLSVDDPLDLLAAVKGADLVITDSAGTFALALAFGRPCQGLTDDTTDEIFAVAEWMSDRDAVVTRPAELIGVIDLAVARGADEAAADRARDALDLRLDDLAIELRTSVGRRLAATTADRLAQLSDRAATLEAALVATQQRMAQERLAFGIRAASLGGGGGGDLLRQVTERAVALEQELRQVRAECEHVTDQLDAIYATKTMRVLKPARDAYGRLRSSRR